MQQQQRDPPGQAARGSRICISYVMHRKFPLSEPDRSEAHDAGCRQPWGRGRVEGSARQQATEGGAQRLSVRLGSGPRKVTLSSPPHSGPRSLGGTAKVGGPDFRELREAGGCGGGNAL